jgi:hypothetical protein
MAEVVVTNWHMEPKLEPDPPPDELEKRIRLGCGAVFGIIPGLWIAVGLLGLRAGWRWACVAAVAGLFAFFSLRYGHRFWFGVLRFFGKVAQ